MKKIYQKGMGQTQKGGFIKGMDRWADRTAKKMLKWKL
jgi:hypothetical protein